MNREYNDSQIMSPELMAQIAKAYSEKFKNINQSENMNADYISEPYNLGHGNFETTNKTYLNMEEYQTLVDKLKLVYTNLTILNKYCSKRFYSRKETEIKSILNKLTATFPDVSPNDSNNQNYAYKTNYCSLITDCIKKLTECLDQVFNIFIKLENKHNADNFHSTLTTIIRDITNLIGECRYRSTF